MIEKEAHDAEGSSPAVEFTGRASLLSHENFLMFIVANSGSTFDGRL